MNAKGIDILDNAIVTMRGHSLNDGLIESEIPRESYGYTGGEYAAWGHGNCWPTSFRRKVERSTIALPTIYKLVAIMYGNGFRYYLNEIEGGKQVKKLIRIDEIDRFIRMSRIQRYMVEQMVDYRFFGNSFSEMIFSRDGRRINRLGHLEAEYTRLARQDKKNGIPFVGYSSDWLGGGTDCPKIPLIDARYPYEHMAAKRHSKLCYHSYMPSPGRRYYAQPYWGALGQRDSWLDVANRIPGIIKTLQRNQARIKYHIKLPNDYWAMWYPKWGSYTEKERAVRKQGKHEEFNKFLGDPENDCATFMSSFGTDPVTKKALPGMQIEAIDDKIKQGEWLPSSEKADLQILYALGVDPSLLNLQSEGKLSSGSGSDKRVAMANSLALMSVERKIILEPLELVADFNGWYQKYPNLGFGFDFSVPTTLDKNPTGQQNVM